MNFWEYCQQISEHLGSDEPVADHIQEVWRFFHAHVGIEQASRYLEIVTSLQPAGE
jgi:hypothetical protein